MMTSQRVFFDKNLLSPIDTKTATSRSLGLLELCLGNPSTMYTWSAVRARLEITVKQNKAQLGKY